MPKYSSAEAARKLGLSPSGLSNYLRHGKIPPPEAVKTGGFVVFAWTEEDIERVRQLLPKIANGRKTRHQLALSHQQSDKTKIRKKKPEATTSQPRHAQKRRTSETPEPVLHHKKKQ